MMRGFTAPFRGRFIREEPKPFYRASQFPTSWDIPWLDRQSAQTEIDEMEKKGEISDSDAEHCRSWERNGFLILPSLISEKLCDDIWDSFEKAMNDGTFGDLQDPTNPYHVSMTRAQNPHLSVKAIAEGLENSEVKRLLSLLLGKSVKSFQTLMFKRGSMQAPHSDSIHMTTHPLGYLGAAWIALEDISEDSGPVEYYPGSHKLPYLFSNEVGIPENGDFEKIHQYYSKNYEPKVRGLIIQNGFRSETFTANKGDVLLWHANLIHGGSTIRNPNLTRKSLVCHYFANGVFCYHDLSGSRAAMLEV